MDIILYFLRWEDKYWGLFLAALLFLAAVALAKRPDPESGESGLKRGLLALSICGLLSYLITICPLTYSLLQKAGITDGEYEHLFHLWQYPVILPLSGSFVLLLACREGEKKRYAMMAGLLFCLFLLSGDLIFTGFESEKVAVKLTEKECRESYDLVLRDAASRGEKATVWGPAFWMAESRMYDSDLYPVYGKDTEQRPEYYGQELLTMKQGFDRYEDPESPLVNMEDQLGAIANTLNLYPDQDCRYVAVFSAEARGGSADTDAIFESCGYEAVGATDKLRIYHHGSVSE